ncbi:UNVERIFIED_CONTAM: hypothetical protein FO527_05110 [Bacillus sp. ATCC 13368]
MVLSYSLLFTWKKNKKKE